MKNEKLIAVTRSKNGVPVRLTNERWDHITTSHLDMKNNQKLLMETVKEPDMILKGVLDELRAVKWEWVFCGSSGSTNGSFSTL